MLKPESCPLIPLVFFPPSEIELNAWIHRMHQWSLETDILKSLNISAIKTSSAYKKLNSRFLKLIHCKEDEQ